MSAEFESGLFVRRPAWHGQGIVVKDVPEIDTAFDVAAMNWTVRKETLFAKVGDELVPSGAFAMMRDKAGFERQILGVVGDKYEPYQNREAFDLMKPIVETGHWNLETCVVLSEGRTCWALLRQGETQIVPNDILKDYLLFTWGHDGNSVAQFQPTSIRVVCKNTLQMALGEKGAVKVRHSANMREKLDFVKDLYVKTTEGFAKQTEMLRRLLDKKLSTATMEAMIEELYGTKSEGKRAQTMSENKLNFIKDFCLNGQASGIVELGIEGTGYGFWNALSELNEHYLLRKGTDAGINILRGNGREMNQKALELILAA